MVDTYQATELQLSLTADDQWNQRLQQLSRTDLVALQDLIHEALARPATGEWQRAAVTPAPADYTTEWWLPD